MSEHLKNIEIYEMVISNFDVIAFESVEMLHQRSGLEQVFDELNLRKRCLSILLRFKIYRFLRSQSTSGGGI